jgi:hypothetical protein
MEIHRFIRSYDYYINLLETIVKPEFQEVINEFRETDPHDLVSPETYFSSSQDCLGFIVSLFIKKINQKKNELVSPKCQ